jgi:hypothetical protein
MADPLNGLGDDPDDLLSGLPEGVVNDRYIKWKYVCRSYIETRLDRFEPNSD